MLWWIQEEDKIMDEVNELLRSALRIAARKGESTNWEAFEKNLTRVLLKQAGVPGTTDEQAIRRAIYTPKTYRIYPTD